MTWSSPYWARQSNQPRWNEKAWPYSHGAPSRLPRRKCCYEEDWIKGERVNPAQSLSLWPRPPHAAAGPWMHRTGTLLPYSPFFSVKRTRSNAHTHHSPAAQCKGSGPLFQHKKGTFRITRTHKAALPCVKRLHDRQGTLIWTDQWRGCTRSHTCRNKG